MSTFYPPSIEARIRELRGDWFDDEIARETDPAYSERYLRAALFSFGANLDGTRIMDFGCGAGASTIVLARLVPTARLIGVELNPEAVEVARLRAAFHGINAEFHTSPSPFELPDLGRFDHIVLNAVWEHLLPAERPVLLPLLLDTLSPGGFLFVCETPHRWFPVETHTTELPLINYLPAPLAHKTARLSGRVGDETWEELLRKGIRGGTVHEIARYARGRATLVPPRQGSYGRLWFETTPHRRSKRLKRLFASIGMITTVTLALRRL